MRLPAVAIQKSDFGYRKSWQETNGNGWNFVIIGFVLYFAGKLTFAFQNAVDNSLTGNDFTLLHYLSSTIDVVVAMLFSGYCISVLTASYSMFVERKDKIAVAKAAP